MTNRFLGLFTPAPLTESIKLYLSANALSIRLSNWEVDGADQMRMVWPDTEEFLIPLADAAQPTQQSAPDGFVPMDDVPAEEQLPAAPLLAAAYIVVWVIAIGYLWTIWRRLGRVEKELAEALRRVGETDGA